MNYLDKTYLNSDMLEQIIQLAKSSVHLFIQPANIFVSLLGVSYHVSTGVSAVRGTKSLLYFALSHMFFSMELLDTEQCWYIRFVPSPQISHKELLKVYWIFFLMIVYESFLSSEMKLRIVGYISTDR